MQRASCNSKEKEKINYRHLGNFCNSCGNKIGSNILSIRQDGGNNGDYIQDIADWEEE